LPQSSEREEERREIRCEGGRDRCGVREREEEEEGMTYLAGICAPTVLRRAAARRKGE
jgi:hypothetical protein